MISDTIIVAILSFAATMIGAYAANRKSTVLMDYRLKKLEEKVDKHNNLIDRTYKLEEKAELFEEKMKVANHRLDDIEGGGTSKR